MSGELREAAEALFPYGIDASGLPKGQMAATAIGLLDVDAAKRLEALLRQPEEPGRPRMREDRREIERLRVEYDLALTMLLERGMAPSEFEARLAEVRRPGLICDPACVCIGAGARHTTHCTCDEPSTKAAI